ncbi:MAG: hypothetical protein AB1546_07750, partial [bacterium]
LIVTGFILNRMNVSVTSFIAYSGINYFPSFREIMITVFFVAIGFIAFSYAVKYFAIFPGEEPIKQEQDDKIRAREMGVAQN